MNSMFDQIEMAKKNGNIKRTAAPPMKFGAIRQADLPYGRAGKHKAIVTQLLSDIEQLKPGEALKVPLTELPDTKVNIRSALNRATQQLGIVVATSSDTEHLYIWKPEGANIPIEGDEE
jgi:hypothetical protein